jgi:ABC-type nitrate/sulfonate/bicarbonate transport system permease component
LAFGVVAPAAALIGVWFAVVNGLHLPSYFAKSPASAWDYFVSLPSAGANRQVILQALGTTARDAGLGFLAGMTVGLAAAYLTVFSQRIRAAMMPFALAARAVPLVAMTPLIALAFGYGLSSVTVVGAIVVFFPTFVTMVEALDALPRSGEELIAVFGGTRWDHLTKLALPGTVRAVFASARIGAPGAVIGATFAEWLITGKGIGYLMVSASETSDFDDLWASVFLVTLSAIVLYNLVAFVQRATLDIAG